MDLSDDPRISETENKETGHIYPVPCGAKTYYLTREAMDILMTPVPDKTPVFDKILDPDEDEYPKCQMCHSKRILTASSHGRDCHNYRIKDFEGDGYLPRDLGIGGEDDMEITLCLECGQLQGEWPLPKSSIEG